MTMANASISRVRSEAHSEAGTLERLLDDARSYSAEFPLFLANHQPMMLVALDHLGASPQRLKEWFAIYRDVSGLVPQPPSVAKIGRADWASHLGDRSRERDYREFFTGEVRRLGIGAAVAAYLPTLIPGIAGSALHAFMRLAYGVMLNDQAEVGAALGYWSAVYLELCRATGAEPDTDDPGEVLLRLRPVEAFHHIEPELDLLWHFMRAMAKQPEFQGVVDRLRIGPDALQSVTKASLALYACTMDFCALHALTGSHWLRVAWPALPQPELALRYFWQAIATLYPKIGFPDLPSAEQLDEWRNTRTPDWPEIKAAAMKRDDEHDISLAFSAFEEWKFYGDSLYRFVAARRVQLIA
jgi:hypothetical protein